MQLEILHGPDMYWPENYECKDPGCPVHGRRDAARREPPRAPSAPEPRPKAATIVPRESIPEPHGRFSEVYSNKHEKLLLRVEHIERLDAIRKAFNSSRVHSSKAPLTTSDIVNACLDFVLQHRIPFQQLAAAEAIRDLIAEAVCREIVSRWMQYNEAFGRR